MRTLKKKKSSLTARVEPDMEMAPSFKKESARLSPLKKMILKTEATTQESRKKDKGSKALCSVDCKEVGKLRYCLTSTKPTFRRKPATIHSTKA
jgi:hypothetical protein